VYTPDSQWRNRNTFVQGREEIVDFLTRKWAREHEYRLIKEVWVFLENRIAVRFASINDLPIDIDARFSLAAGEATGRPSGPFGSGVVKNHIAVDQKSFPFFQSFSYAARRSTNPLTSSSFLWLQAPAIISSFKTPLGP